MSFCSAAFDFAQALCQEGSDLPVSAIYCVFQRRAARRRGARVGASVKQQLDSAQMSMPCCTSEHVGRRVRICARVEEGADHLDVAIPNGPGKRGAVDLLGAGVNVGA
jgi:hypothetical protein